MPKIKRLKIRELLFFNENECCGVSLQLVADGDKKYLTANAMPLSIILALSASFYTLINNSSLYIDILSLPI